MTARRSEPLARHTTLELGGPADWFVEASAPSEVVDIERWARRDGLAVRILGGGSNVVVADHGVNGVVMHVDLRGVAVRELSGDVVVEVGAGEPWDDFVARAVAEGWSGIECLSGIPGTVGATPIQNVGAYGQEIAEVVESVTVVDRRTLATRRLTADECAFSYRTSRFRRRPESAVVVAVAFRLRVGGPPVVRYRELEQLVSVRKATPDLSVVREAVLELRRRKSMVLDDADPNRRSVGSFFLNPQLDSDTMDHLTRRAVDLELVPSVDGVPRFPVEDGRVKVPAAWLIEAAGFRKGYRRGAVGLSSAHALALIHHGGGSTRELLRLAGDIRRAVWSRFGVWLQPEPVLWGFEGTRVLEDQSAL